MGSLSKRLSRTIRVSQYEYLTTVNSASTMVLHTHAINSSIGTVCFSWIGENSKFLTIVLLDNENNEKRNNGIQKRGLTTSSAGIVQSEIVDVILRAAFLASYDKLPVLAMVHTALGFSTNAGSRVLCWP